MRKKMKKKNRLIGNHKKKILHTGESIVDGIEERRSSDPADFPSGNEEHAAGEEASRHFKGRLQSMAIHVGTYVG